MMQPLPGEVCPTCGTKLRGNGLVPYLRTFILKGRVHVDTIEQHLKSTGQVFTKKQLYNALAYLVRHKLVGKGGYGVYVPISDLEREKFQKLVDTTATCPWVNDQGCACMGNCLGNKLALLRKEYDYKYKRGPDIDKFWWSDQGHCSLLQRIGDAGRNGAALTAENYWSGAK